MRIDLAAAALSLLTCSAGLAEAPRNAGTDTPLSAIDWLSLQSPVSVALPLDEPPITQSGTVPAVSVAPLGSPVVRRTGLLPANVTGLAPGLWSDSPAEGLVRALKAARTQSVPAANELLLTLLLAEADDLAENRAAETWLLARTDALLYLGAVEPAFAMISQAGADSSPALAGRWLDLALLTRREATPCSLARTAPHLLQNQAARVFCLARLGDVDTAALVFGTGAALGSFTPVTEALLARYLDPDLFEGSPLPRAPVRPDVLTFRLFEAAGEPLPTTPLPRAFAVVDLGEEAGWKARLEAAERLARTGVLPSNLLLGLYSDRKAAASGGIWDRVSAFQKFEAALSRKDIKELRRRLPAMWRGMQAAGLEVVFSDLFADDLTALALDGPEGGIAFDMALLSRGYESATAPQNATARQAFLSDLARGTPKAEQAKTVMERRIAAAFSGGIAPSATITATSPGTLGATLLDVLDRSADAGRGDTSALGQVLADLRALGLEDIARRFALQMLILREQT